MDLNNLTRKDFERIAEDNFTAMGDVSDDVLRETGYTPSPEHEADTEDADLAVETALQAQAEYESTHLELPKTAGAVAVEHALSYDEPFIPTAKGTALRMQHREEIRISYGQTGPIPESTDREREIRRAGFQAAYNSHGPGAQRIQ